MTSNNGSDRTRTSIQHVAAEPAVDDVLAEFDESTPEEIMALDTDVDPTADRPIIEDFVPELPTRVPSVETDHDDEMADLSIEALFDSV